MVSTVLSTTKASAAICLAAALTTTAVPSVTAFAPPTSHTCPLPIGRGQPLHSFEVMNSVEATIASHGSIVMSNINSFFQSQPYLAAFLTCSFKASAADMIAQNQERLSHTNDVSSSSSSASSQITDSEVGGVDISRNLGFLFYGGIYQGMAQNYLFSSIYPSIFGSGDSWATIATEVVVDNMLVAPLICLPIAYMFKTAFTSNGPLGVETLQKGIEKYIQDVTTKGLLTQYWKVWFPANVITFGVIPPHFRVIFVAAVSFFWICLLSSISSSSSNESAATTAVAASQDQEESTFPSSMVASSD